jgi:hypothetical protein
MPKRSVSVNVRIPLQNLEILLKAKEKRWGSLPVSRSLLLQTLALERAREILKENEKR